MGRGKVASLIEGETPEDRRARKGIKVSDPAGDPTEYGFETNNPQYLHITIKMPDPSTTLDWQLWYVDETSGEACLDTRLGTGGTVSMTEADVDNPQISIIAIAAHDRVWIKLFNFSGTFTAGVDVWLAGSGEL